MYRGTTLDDMPMPTPAKTRPTPILSTPFDVPLCHPMFQPSVRRYRELKDKRHRNCTRWDNIHKQNTPTFLLKSAKEFHSKEQHNGYLLICMLLFVRSRIHDSSR